MSSLAAVLFSDYKAGLRLSMCESVFDAFTDEPPTASIEPQQQTIKQGSDVTIQCEVTGSPAPTVHWSKVRSVLGPNQRVSKYTVSGTGSNTESCVVSVQ